MAKGTLSRLKRTDGKRRKSDVTDPRQVDFLIFYLDPKSETYGNALQSGLRAKFSQEYSENITRKMPSWLNEEIGRLNFMKKVEDHFNEILEMPVTKKVFKGKGKNRKATITYDVKRIKEKTDVSKFVASTLGRKRYGPHDDSVLPPLQTLIIINAPEGTTHRVLAESKAVASTAVIGRPDND